MVNDNDYAGARPVENGPRLLHFVGGMVFCFIDKVIDAKKKAEGDKKCQVGVQKMSGCDAVTWFA